MTTVYLIGGVVSAIVAAIIGAFIWGGRYTKHKRDAQDARRVNEAESTRRRIEDDIDQDTDLADRARRPGGIVRPASRK